MKSTLFFFFNSSWALSDAFFWVCEAKSVAHWDKQFAGWMNEKETSGFQPKALPLNKNLSLHISTATSVVVPNPNDQLRYCKKWKERLTKRQRHILATLDEAKPLTETNAAIETTVLSKLRQMIDNPQSCIKSKWEDCLCATLQRIYWWNLHGLKALFWLILGSEGLKGRERGIGAIVPDE